ncbi:MAG TPA: C39 family peptidase, partial [Bryobacteraceae bacterium]
MSASPVVIPYEKQSDPQVNRGCGAACLSMVYRSFGKEVPQAEIWPAIAKKNRFGSIASTSHLMAQDANKR